MNASIDVYICFRCGILENDQDGESGDEDEFDYSQLLQFYSQAGPVDGAGDVEPPLHIALPNGHICLGYPLNYKIEDVDDGVNDDCWLYTYPNISNVSHLSNSNSNSNNRLRNRLTDSLTNNNDSNINSNINNNNNNSGSNNTLSVHVNNRNNNNINRNNNNNSNNNNHLISGFDGIQINFGSRIGVRRRNRYGYHQSARVNRNVNVNDLGDIVNTAP